MGRLSDVQMVLSINEMHVPGLNIQQAHRFLRIHQLGFNNSLPMMKT